MKIIVGKRGSGKTYSMFKYCQDKNIPIITPNKKRKYELKRYANDLGFNVTVLTLEEYNHLKIENKIGKQICIDDLELFINEALDLDVVKANVSDKDIIIQDRRK